VAQVCWDLDNPATRAREIEGLAAAMQELNLKKGMILTLADEDEIKLPGAKISILPVYRWLLS
jgi:hypothetical protein